MTLLHTGYPAMTPKEISLALLWICSRSHLCQTSANAFLVAQSLGCVRESNRVATAYHAFRAFSSTLTFRLFASAIDAPRATYLLHVGHPSGGLAPKL